MSKKRRCDICDKQIEIFRWRVWIVSREEWFGGRVDICDDCWTIITRIVKKVRFNHNDNSQERDDDEIKSKLLLP